MKKTLLAIAIITASSSAVAGWTSPDGRLTVGGDAEINFDISNNENGVSNAKIGTDKGATNTQLGDDSRIKIDVTWRDTREDGSYIQATAQPLLKTNGSVEMDDAFFAFGVDKSWMFQIGRYEAMDLFPLGRDIVVDYAAGSDAIGEGTYYYMAKEGRGRSGEAGQARINGQFGNWTAEVSTVYGDTKEVLGEASDDLNNDITITSKGNSFMVRPAVNYLSDSGTVSISFGGEYEAQSDSVEMTKGNNKYDLADRYGLAATASLTFGELVWNNSVAYQDIKDLWEANTFNSNIAYKAFGLGASHAKNKYVEDKKTDTKSYVVYTSYTVPVLYFKNAEVTFALSYSQTDNAYGTKGNDEETTAFRTRFNYYF